MADAHPFAGLDGSPRPPSRTMVADWGIGPGAQADLLEVGGDFFDLAKIAVGISRLLPAAVLEAKINAYRRADVQPFPGGQYLEYAQLQQQTDPYLEACVRAGYAWIEVSDNMGEVTTDWKIATIRRAREAFGLQVLGEVGKKEGLDSGLAMADDARRCREAGADIVLLEAAELVSDDAATAAEVEAVVGALGLDRVMFELPGPWIAGVSHHDIHRMRRDLIQRYGPAVHIGNVHPEDLVPLEALRRGLGVNAGKRTL